jgi:uncharacterized delta-60 repeat protein
MIKSPIGSLLIAGLLSLFGSAHGVEIITQPQTPLPVNEGSALNLSVVANPAGGATGVLYQWYQDGKILSGATSATYNVPSANGTHSGTYFVAVTDTGLTETGANNSVKAIAVQGNGRVLIGGSFTTYHGTSRNSIARLSTGGSVDASFNPVGANNTINAVVLQPDARILIGGAFTTFNGNTRNRIARLFSDGSLDPFFDAGAGANADVIAVALQTDGSVLIGGTFTSFDGTARSGVARLESDGDLDTTFNPGSGVNAAVNALAVQTNGRIVIGGSFTTYNGTARSRIARLNSDGTLDASFDPGTGANGDITTVVLQADGKALIGGNFTTYNGTARNRIARLNTDGTLDTSFDPGTGANNFVNRVVLQTDGKLVIGGNFTSYNGTVRNGIARVNTDGTLDALFAAGSGASGGAINAVALQTDGEVLIGGDFTSYGGAGCNRIARLNTDSSLDTAFTPGTKQSENSVVTVHLRPRIKVAPKSITVTQTGKAEFTVQHSGSTLNESFQWQKYNEATKSWANIPGATAQTLVIDPVAPGDGGKYRVVVNNVTTVAMTSAAATLTVRTVPVIKVQPTSLGVLRAIARGGSTTLKVVATGVTPMTYMWEFKPVGGAFGPVGTNSASLTVKGEEASEGTYRVTITNELNNPPLDLPDTISDEVDVVVDDKPTIADAGQPTAAAAYTAGDNPVDLTVTPSGDPPFSFLWQKDGKNVAGPARFNGPTDIVSDGAGGVLVVDSMNHAIRLINAAGTVSTFAGGLGISGTANDTGTAARFNLPYGIAADGSGDFYVTDSGNHTVRKVTAGGVVTLVAGIAGTSGFQDETGALASFNTPTGIAVDSNGNIFVSDSRNHTIRKMTPGGVVTTFAGTAGVIGSNNGTGAAAEFNTPMGLAIDSDDNLYVADSGNNAIRIIKPTGEVAIFAGLPGAPGKVDGAIEKALFNAPVGVEVLANDDVLVVERLNHAVRRIAASVVSTVAGKLGTAGAVDGTLTAARFNGPVGIAATGAGEVSLVEAINHTVRRYALAQNLVQTLGGSALTSGARDGAGLANEATLKIGPIHWTDRGVYKVIVRNRVGSVTSKTVKVVVNSPPVFLVQPVDAAGATGKTASFSAVVGGNTPLQYEWFFFKQGDPPASLSAGKKTSSPKLSLTKLSAATHEGFYFCRAYNNLAPLGVDSATVRLTILDAPAGTIALTANSNPKGVFGKVPVGGTFTLTATATAGGADVRYQWLIGSKNFGGETTSNVLVVNPAKVTHSGAWSVLIKNAAAATKSNIINIQVLTPPEIVADPQPVGAVVEDDVTFKVVAKGSSPLTYQWYENGQILENKKTATLLLSKVTLAMSNRVYSCKVTNSVGDVTSADALLTVGPAPIPSFANYYPPQARVGEKVRITGTGLAYTKTVVFGTQAAPFVIEPDGSILATVPTKLDTTPTGGPATQTGGPSVNIFVRTRGGDSTNVPMPFSPFAATTFSNDFRRHATILTGESVLFNGDNSLFVGGDGGTFFPSGIGDGSTAWFVWTPAETNTYSFYVQSVAGQDVSIAVYDLPYANTTTEPAVWPWYSDDYFGNGGFDVTRAVVEVSVVAGRQYTIFVGGYYTYSAGQYQLQIWKGPASLRGLSTGYQASASLVPGASVMSQTGWDGQGDAAAAQVAESAGGTNSKVVLGGVASEDGAVVWPELAPEEREAKYILGVNLTFDSPAGATSDQFNWTLYDQNMEPAGAVWFNNSDGSIYATTADGSVVPSAQKFGSGTYHLEMVWDADAGLWNATIDGVTLFEVMELPAGTQFGGISAGWVPGSGSETPASMSFDGIALPNKK